MKLKTDYLRITCSVLFIFFAFTFKSFSEIVSYPAPPGRKTSSDFTLKANNTPVWVERIGSKLKSFSYTLYSGKEMEELNVANFSCSGEVNIEITAKENIQSYVIRPKSRNIVAKITGRSMFITLSDPQKLYIEINRLPHLAIFVNPPEVNPPKQGDQSVIFLGPGTYSKDSINLKSNQTLYIAGGAVLNTKIRGKNLHNVRITGRGILQGNIEISGTSNLEVEGIFICNTEGWTNTLTDCHNCIYHNVKIFSYEAIYSVDGIDVVSSTNFTIDDCFMRCRDDCVAIKSGDIKLHVDSVFVSNCVMVGWACSDGVTLGFELNGGPVENVFVKNCDILYARGGGRTNGHSGFSIVCDGPAWVQNIHFEDIRIEEQVEFKNLEFIVTDGTLYGSDPPGHIKGVYLRNIRWEKPGKPFIISGYSANNTVEDITLDHCYAGGKILTGISDADFRLNSFTKNITFK
jgi:hypothetical protein